MAGERLSESPGAAERLSESPGAGERLNSTDGAPEPRLLARLTPWWVRVGLVFLVSRVVSTVLLLAFAANQEANPWTGARPSYTDFAQIWDGHWYLIIALSGYPSELPITAEGRVGENAWAFMPAYPALVRALMTVTSADFGTVSVAVSVLFALGTALVFYRLMVRFLAPGDALFAVVLYCFAPLSPVLQVSYAESMFAFLVALALLLLVTRRYVLLVPVVLVMGLTRPGALAVALALGVHAVHRYLIRARDPFPVRERTVIVVVGLFSVLVGFSWPVVVGWVTGVPSGYVDTELAWRSVYVGHQPLFPFSGLVQGIGWWSDWFQVPVPLVVAGLLGVAVLFGWLVFGPWGRRLGVDIRAWVIGYALYILAVFFPQSSTFRILLPLYPVLGALAVPRNAVYRILIVPTFVALQAAWLYVGWWVDGYDWTPP